MENKGIWQYETQQQPAPQEMQTTPQAQEKLDPLGAQIAAGMYHALQADAQQALDKGVSPDIMAHVLIKGLFGDDSPQAAAAEKLIDTDIYWAGYEPVAEMLRLWHKYIIDQRKRIENYMGMLDAELTHIADVRGRFKLEQMGKTRCALMAVLAFRNFCTDLKPAEFLRHLQTLYEKHHDDPEAMGLLYGAIRAHRHYIDTNLDLIQRQAVEELQQKIAGALLGTNSTDDATGGDL